MKTMVFANDLMVWRHKEEEMQDKLNTWKEVIRECDMKLITRNVNK